MSSSLILIISLCNNTTPILNNMVFPPYKICFSDNVDHNIILLQLKWVALLHIIQYLPRGYTINTHNENLPPFCCFFYSLTTKLRHHKIFIFFHIRPVSVMINIIHLCKHIFCNFIGKYGIFVSILIIYFINYGV